MKESEGEVCTLTFSSSTPTFILLPHDSLRRSVVLEDSHVACRLCSNGCIVHLQCTVQKHICLDYYVFSSQRI